MVNITPTTSVIEAMRKQYLQWHIILGEFIDNAFDAGATRVSIEFDKNQLKITDDGSGCKDLVLMLKPGARESKTTTILGRYGIGAKDAAISAADAIAINSIHKGKQRFIQCDWRRVERSGIWEIDDPVETETDKASGTTISLMQLRSDRLKKPDQLVERLSFQYTPAIKQGRQIILKTSKQAAAIPIPEFLIPVLEHQKEADIDLGDKVARVVMGLIPEGSKFQERGLMISYGYRVVSKGQTIGLGSEPTPGLFGRIELGKGWDLTKNKDKVDSDVEALADEIYRVFRDVIDRASKRSQAVHFGSVTKEINQILKEFTQGDDTAKAKRGSKRAESGSILPRNTDRKHRQAARTQPGDSFRAPNGASRGLSISFEHLGESGPACRCDGNAIYLNVDIPAIKVDSSDPRALSRHAIYAASTYFAIAQPELFPDFEGSFAKAVHCAGHLLSRLNQPGIALANVG